MKNVLSILLTVLVLALCGTAVSAEGISVYLNDAPVQMDASSGMPFMDPAGRVMVPLRVVAEAAGKRVSFDEGARAAIIEDDDLKVTVPLDKAHIIRGRELLVNDAPARILNGRTYLPIRLVMESFGYQVRWDGGLRRVFINGPAVSGAPVMPEPAEPPVDQPKDLTLTVSENINLYNGGYMAQAGEDLYFINGDDGERVWRVNLATGIGNRISELKARSLCVADGWIYYRQETLSNRWEIYRSDSKGKNTEMVSTGDVGWMKIQEGVLYYYLTDLKALYRRELTKPFGDKYIDKEMTAINLEGRWLTYVSMAEDSEGKLVPGDIYKVDIQTRERTLLSTERSGEKQPLAALIGDKLYVTLYNDALSLYAIDLESGRLDKVTDRWTYNVTGDGESLYTLFPENKSGLYRLDLQTGKLDRVSDDWRPGTYHDPGLTVINGKIYFLKRVTTLRYGWMCYDPETGRTSEVAVPGGFAGQ